MLRRAKPLKNVLAVKSTCKLLLGSASSVVTGVKADDGYVSPAAWRAFPQAFRLHITNGDWMNVRHKDYTDRITATCGELPERIRDIYIGRAGIYTRARLRPCSAQLASALIISPCHLSIRRLNLHFLMTIPAAEALANNLPHLEDLSVAVCSDKHADKAVLSDYFLALARHSKPRRRMFYALVQPSNEYQVWRPCGPGFAKLHAVAISSTQDLAIDVSGLQGAAQMTGLVLKTGPVVNWQALSGLAALQRLRLELGALPGLDQPGPMPADLAWLAGLTQLRELVLAPGGGGAEQAPCLHAAARQCCGLGAAVHAAAAGGGGCAGLDHWPARARLWQHQVCHRGEPGPGPLCA